MFTDNIKAYLDYNAAATTRVSTPAAFPLTP